MSKTQGQWNSPPAAAQASSQGTDAGAKVRMARSNSPKNRMTVAQREEHSTDDEPSAGLPRPPSVPAGTVAPASVTPAGSSQLVAASALAPLAAEAAAEAVKRKVKKACFLCKNAHACCDFKRPCSRCVKNGMAEVCFDTEGKKRGRKTKAQKAAEAIMRMNGESATADSLRALVAEQSMASPGAALQDAPDSDVSAAAGIIANTNTVWKRPAAAAPSLYASLPPANLPSSESALATTLALSRATERDRVLTDVNRLLLTEIRELKADQERLYEEIRSLKEQQQQRQAAAAAAAAATATQHAPPAMTIASNNDSQSAVVVYDLTKKPAVVQSANTAFCRMLGYSVEEAHGASWHKFVYPPYVERALGILQPHLTARGQSTTSVTFEQVYQHKNGTLVRTIDSHNIFFIDGQPTSDVITVTPMIGGGPLPSISLENSAPSGSSETLAISNVPPTL